MTRFSGLAILIVFIVFFAAVTAFILRQLNENGETQGVTVAEPENLPGIQTTNYPWKVEVNNLRERLDLINLPPLPTEGTTLHTHQHLDIFIESQHVEIPAEIGINQGERFISPVHTHDLTGIIHVESPTIRTFTLGQFFDVWGVRFTNECLGSYCNRDNKFLRVYSNGQLVTTNVRDLALEQHQQITVVYGEEGQFPSPIPESYNFPPGY